MRRSRLFRLTGLLILILFSHSVLANSIRIMPLGDTDTAGWAGYLSYRYDLWFQLMDAGFDVDFVGSKRTAIFDSELYPRADDLDPDHEGVLARTIEDMIDIAPMLIQENQPHVVMWKGSHDICDTGSGATSIVISRLPELIDTLRAEDPDLQFVIATAYDWFSNCEPDARDIIPDFNQAIADVVAAKDTPQSRVLLVDHYSGFNIETMYDTTLFHANRQGEMFLASQWFDVLEDLLPTIEVGEGDFSINAGLNDAWFNPVTLGQGFFVTVFEDIQMMFLAWFTYDTERPAGGVMANLGEPGHRWLTAFGPYSGNTATLDIELTSGGVFDAATPAPGSVPDGTIMVEFDGCNAATVSYDILSANVAGDIPIERIALDNVAICEALTE